MPIPYTCQYIIGGLGFDLETGRKSSLLSNKVRANDNHSGNITTQDDADILNILTRVIAADVRKRVADSLLLHHGEERHFALVIDRDGVIFSARQASDGDARSREGGGAG